MRTHPGHWRGVLLPLDLESPESGLRTREQYPHHDKTDSEGYVVAWLVLILSGMLEAVWASALSASKGFKKPVPVVVFLVSLTVSMAGLAWAMTQLPTGTAYAVWVGIGAALTVIYAMATGDEAFSAWKAVFIAGIILAVIGLKLVPEKKALPAGEVSRD